MRCILRSLFVLSLVMAMSGNAWALRENYTDVASGGVVGGGKGAQLKANGGAINIAAPIAQTLVNPAGFPYSTGNGPGSITCYGLTNRSATKTYFVPYQTNEEWSAFLKAIGAQYQLSVLNNPNRQTLLSPANMAATGAVNGFWITDILVTPCCVPEAIDDMCIGYADRFPVAGSKGDRFLGTRVNPVTSSEYNTFKGLLPSGTNLNAGTWGAVGDAKYVEPPPGSPINYHVTFTCSPGTNSWVVTNTSGTCIPTAGHCASNPSTGYTKADFDAASNAALCDNNVAPLDRGGNGPFTWRCPASNATLQDAYCTAPLDTGVNGKCSAIHNTVVDTLPVSTQLCDAGAPTPLAWDWGTHWTWSCKGTNGHNDASCWVTPTTPPYDGRCVDCSYIYTDVTAHYPYDLCHWGNLNMSSFNNDGAGNFTWQCLGGNGGVNDSCSCGASYVRPRQDGECGGYDSNTNIGYCHAGPAGPVTINGGHSTWTCFGISGGSDTACSWDAPAPVAGICAPMTYSQSSPPVPIANCQKGTPSNLSTIGPPWSWQCLGDNNGATAFCSDSTPPPTAIDGQCGSAAGGTGSVTAPANNLCATGNASNVVQGTLWNWQCFGLYGGNAASCSTNIVPNPARADAVCGPANGTTVPDAPNFNLCSVGTGPTVASGTGPWTWTCTGVAGGANVTCGASICQACRGSSTQNVLSSSTTKSFGGGCTATANASWIETDTLDNNPDSKTLTWSDQFHGAFSKVITSGTTGVPYCQPCYKVPTGVSNTQVNVTSTTGSCPFGAAPRTLSTSGVQLQ